MARFQTEKSVFRIFTLCIFILCLNSNQQGKTTSVNSAKKEENNIQTVNVDSLVANSNSKTKKDQSGNSNLSNGEKNAVKRILKANPGWRIATSLDNNDSEELTQYKTEHPGYEPYFVQGKIGDAEGFAIALINKKGRFAVIWFYHPNGDSLHFKSQWLTKSGALEKGGLFLDQRGLILGNCFDCDNSVLFTWNKKTKQLKTK